MFRLVYLTTVILGKELPKLKMQLYLRYLPKGEGERGFTKQSKSLDAFFCALKSLGFWMEIKGRVDQIQKL